MREHLPVQWTSDMSKPGKSNNETAAAAADTPGKTAKSQREPKKKAKHLAKEWGEKIKLTLEAGQKAQKALAEYIIPYFNEVQREIASEIASKDFSFGVSELKEQKPVRVHFRLGDGRIAEILVTSTGLMLERSDQPKEKITKIDVEGKAQTIENVTKLITAFMERES
jgi:hypothetical protein